MADDSNFSSNPERSEGGPRGGRNSGGRDLGGFRIRLSDNELKAARALQEAFQLRSTVAVLGFSLRTLAQMLEEGQLDELITRVREQGGGRPDSRGERSGPRGGDRRPERSGDRDRSEPRNARPNPFARPSKPQPPLSGEPEPAAIDGSNDASASDDSGLSVAETTELTTAGEMVAETEAAMEVAPAVEAADAGEAAAETEATSAS